MLSKAKALLGALGQVQANTNYYRKEEKESKEKQNKNFPLEMSPYTKIPKQEDI